MRKKRKTRFLPLERFFHKKGLRIVAGLDEAGRGPLAGPLVCAAVILKPRMQLPGLTDSKLLTQNQKDFLYEKIRAKARVGVGIVKARYIDDYGLIKACETGFRRAYLDLSVKPDFLLIDGNDHFTFSLPFQSIIRGDRRVRSIAAASVIAKVVRDRLMRKLHRRFPQYSFDRHKGYGTRLHKTLLVKFGPCEVHRKRYKPVMALI